MVINHTGRYPFKRATNINANVIRGFFGVRPAFAVAA